MSVLARVAGSASVLFASESFERSAWTNPQREKSRYFFAGWQADEKRLRCANFTDIILSRCGSQSALRPARQE
jgi:hypothetical protein